MDIYWIKDKRKCGPSTVPDVISLVQMGELTPESLGWHAGCPKWLPLRELPALADFLNKEEDADSPEEEDRDEDEPAPAAEEGLPPAKEELPLPPLPESPSDAGSLRLYLPSPAARLMARLVDCALYATLLYGGFYLYQVPYERTLLPMDNPLIWLPMVLLEAILLASRGTTPGKALMGIRVHTFPENGKPSFLRALGRSISVFTLGMGMMYVSLPLLPLMMGLSYWRLRRVGITSWDARCATMTVQQKPSTPSRFVLAAVTLYIGLNVVGACLQPWTAAILDDMEKISPETATTLRGMLPRNMRPEPPAATPAPAPQAQQGPPQLRI